MKEIHIPEHVQKILNTMHKAQYEAYVVGGCVRDVLRNVDPKDWDITTNAKPEQIQKLFPKSFYNNEFGTVGIKTKNDVVEVTPYRTEQGYSDGRHPDKVEFGDSLEEDLQRRDFTVNAMAYDGEKIVDPYDGQKDLHNKIIRAVGNPEERLEEDALRLMRACRFAGQLSFEVEEQTYKAIQKHKENIKKVSQERIRDELIKIVESDNAIYGMWMLRETGLLKYIIPELEDGVGVKQNLHHIYTVFFHNIMSLQHCPSDDYRVRIAALLHDVGKPETKEGTEKESTFHNHEIVGAAITRKILKRLRFSKEDVRVITHLVRMHMFYYSMGELTDAAVRRIVKRIGTENLRDAFMLRVADRMGSGCQVEIPFKLKELQKRIEKVSKDPITTSMLKIDGGVLIKELGIQPGPRLGYILNSLLEEVLDNPEKNSEEYLIEKAKEIHEKAPEGDDLELKRSQDKDLKGKIDKIEKQENKELNKKYFN